MIDLSAYKKFVNSLNMPEADKKRIILNTELFYNYKQLDENQAKLEKMLDNMKRRQKPKINDRRRFKLEDEQYVNPYLRTIPMGEGRPLRDKIINTDDIITLNVAFNRSRTIEEFLGRV
jgi:hypothetical protein